jgi:hypothetical protein
MKLLKFGLRFWITVTSIFSFVAGWIMLAHAPKPNQANALVSSVTPLQTLEPLRPLSELESDDNPFQSQSFFNFQPRNQRPFFSTGGS